MLCCCLPHDASRTHFWFNTAGLRALNIQRTSSLRRPLGTSREKGSLFKLWCCRCLCIVSWVARKRTRNGAVPKKIRLAVALRILAGASYLDVAVLFGIPKETVFHVLWEVVDAINNTPEVGPFFFPQTVEECARQAKEWEVCIGVLCVYVCVCCGVVCFVGNGRWCHSSLLPNGSRFRPAHPQSLLRRGSFLSPPIVLSSKRPYYSPSCVSLRRTTVDERLMTASVPTAAVGSGHKTPSCVFRMLDRHKRSLVKQLLGSVKEEKKIGACMDRF